MKMSEEVRKEADALIARQLAEGKIKRDPATGLPLLGLSQFN